MDFIIRDIRTRLTDAALNAIVPINDITGAWTAETANYPSIALQLTEGAGIVGLTGLSSVILEVTIYSDTNSLEAHQIYDLVKGLLNEQAAATTSADRLFHLLYELDVTFQYNLDNDIWKSESRYQILYSTSGIVATSGASGAIYAATSGVTAIAGNKIADFKGPLILDLGYEVLFQTEQERFAKSHYTHKGRGSLKIQEVIFKAATFDELYGISANASDTLADGITASTSRTFTQSVKPATLEFLFQMTRTDDGKKLEILATNTYCPATQIIFSKRDLTVHDCEFFFAGDSSGNFVKINEEN